MGSDPRGRIARRVRQRAGADRIQSHGRRTGQASERFIIAAVANEPTAFLANAGGTPRGYDNIVPYGATSAARARMRSLEKDYGLREVSEWPIKPLHMDCAVLKIPEARIVPRCSPPCRPIRASSSPNRCRLSRHAAVTTTLIWNCSADFGKWMCLMLIPGRAARASRWPSSIPAPTRNMRICAAESRRRAISSTPMPSNFGVTGTARKWPALLPRSATTTKASSVSRRTRVSSCSKRAGS